MGRQRGWFYLALALFLGWVAFLGGMALFSADRPRPRATDLTPSERSALPAVDSPER